MKTIALLLLLAAWAIPALAADGSGLGSGDVTLGAGAVRYEPGDGDPRWGPRGTARYFFNERWAAEGALQYVNEAFPNGLTAHTGAVQGTLMYLFGRGALHVEPLAGVGGYFSRVDGNAFHRNLERFAPHVGVALEAWLGKDQIWSIAGSWRHVWLPDLDEAGSHFQREGEQIDIGLTRKFGKLKRS